MPLTGATGNPQPVWESTVAQYSTYMASLDSFTGVAGNIFEITGSASTTVYVLRIVLQLGRIRYYNFKEAIYCLMLIQELP